MLPTSGKEVVSSMHGNIILSILILTDLLAGPPFVWVLLNPHRFNLFTGSRPKEEETAIARHVGWLLVAAWLGLVAILLIFKITAIPLASNLIWVKS